MSVVGVRGTAPPVVRRIGYYLLALSVVSLLSLIMAAVHGELRWYHVVSTSTSFAIALGLLLEKRWAYVAALVVAGGYTLFFLGVLVFTIVWPSGLGLTVSFILLVDLALVGPPLLMLSERGRAWFQRREPAGLPA